MESVQDNLQSLLQQAPASLDAIADHVDSIPYWLRVAGLCVISATVADDLKDRFLLHFWVTFLAGWGGGLSAAVLLARPDALPINMFAKGHDIIILVVWWLANYFPFGLPGYVLRLKPVQMVASALRHMCRAATMARVMSLTAQLHPSATVAVIIMGCIGGGAGKVLHDTVRGGYHLARAPDEVSMPGMGMHSAMAGSVLFYWLVIVQQALSPRQGFNVFASLATVVHTITNIPQPRLPQAALAGNSTRPASKVTAGSTAADSTSSTAAKKKRK